MENKVKTVYNTGNFEKGLKKQGITLTDVQMSQFLRYYELLVEWNRKINLTAVTEFNEVMTKHFIDSLSSAGLIGQNRSGRLIDVGTGAGFPGIPLKILFPELNVVLLDALNKRILFLETVIGELGLEKISAHHGRAEEFGRDPLYRETFDFCVTRAVSNISTISEYCVPFLKKDGAFIAYKGGDPSEEIAEYEGGIRKLNANVEKLLKFELDFGGEELGRTLVVIRRTGELPDKYPRRSGKPEKSPLR